MKALRLQLIIITILLQSADIFAQEGNVWPGSHKQLVFLWTDGNADNIILDANGNVASITRALPRGGALYTRHHAMDLTEGPFTAVDCDEKLLDECRRTNELTIEAVLTPLNMNHTGPARIISFSSGLHSRNFTLGQERSELVLRLRTPQTGDNGSNPQVTLLTLDQNVHHHIIVTYRDGEMVCYLDGEKVFASDAVRGGFSNWEPHQLLFGDEPDGSRRWEGLLEGIAIYSRFLESSEASEKFELHRQRTKHRLPAERTIVKARLVVENPVPDPADIPHRRVLVISHYEAEIVIEGQLRPGDQFAAARWGILDGKAIHAERAVGNSHFLVLGRFADNPQLDGELYRLDHAPLHLPLFLETRLYYGSDGIELTEEQPDQNYDEVDAWPGSHRRLVFLWENNLAPNHILNEYGEIMRTCSVSARRGGAAFTETGAMQLGDGLFVAEEASDMLLLSCLVNNELTIEALITPASLNASGPARIISFSTDTGSRNFTLGQERDQLLMRLRTPLTGPNGLSPQVTLLTLTANTPHHVILTYRDGEMICYLNGREILATFAVRGNFSNWEPHHLVFGDEYADSRPWAGQLEGIAISSRFIGATEAENRFAAYVARMAER